MSVEVESPSGPAVPRTRRPTKPDALLAAAADSARAAAEQQAPGAVGEHLGVQVDADRVVTHLFASTLPGYRGWRWAVTVSRASRGKTVGIDEVVQLPGPEALLAPPWVPWSERLRPGDLGVGDLLPTDEDDDRLVPAYAVGDDPEADEVGNEIGLGRVRVLSVVGRDEAAQRWHAGTAGPSAPIARAAPAPCGTCGFLTRLAGSLRQAFGVCANEFAPDDGRVVALDHGCGAHSEAVVVPAAPATTSRLDDWASEPVELEPLTHPPGSTSDEEPAEPLGHS